MGVQKRRVSHARQGERRSHHALTTPQLEECSHRHQQKQAHHACPTCGWYKGREAVRIKQRSTTEAGS
ncbi:MAG: 50S ribosomal protein L32 [Chloroflexota bacterium]